MSVDSRALLTGDMVRPVLWHRNGVARWCRETLAEPLLSVLFPPRCVGCGDFETHLCSACRSTLVDAGAESCRRCGEPGLRPLVRGRCSACMDKELEYESARSAFVHEGAARRLVADFKFGGQPVLGRLMGDLARPAFADFVSSVASPGDVLVTWVPTHRSAKRERGYNQAEILARALTGSPASTPCTDLVVKPANTRHQKGLGRADRLSNLRGAFRPHPQLEAKIGRDGGFGDRTRFSAIVLVDDVYTTGATAAAVSSVLTSATGLPVHIFTFSRAVSGRSQGHD
jgi:predicted amidophosphoribosyltransferase